MKNEKITKQDKDEFAEILQNVTKCMHGRRVYTCLSALTYAMSIMLISIDDETPIDELLDVADEQLRATTSHLLESSDEVYTVWDN